MVIRGAWPMPRRCASCAAITTELPIEWPRTPLSRATQSMGGGVQLRARIPSRYAHREGGGQAADDDIEQAARRIPVVLRIKGRLSA